MRVLLSIVLIWDLIQLCFVAKALLSAMWMLWGLETFSTCPRVRHLVNSKAPSHQGVCFQSTLTLATQVFQFSRYILCQYIRPCFVITSHQYFSIGPDQSKLKGLIKTWWNITCCDINPFSSCTWVVQSSSIFWILIEAGKERAIIALCPKLLQMWC